MKKLLILLGFILLLSCKEDEDLILRTFEINDPIVNLEGVIDTSLIVDQVFLKSY